jgi:hypothetical protein
MALGVSTVVVGTMCGRFIMGPTDSATHLFMIILAASGYGKDHPLQCGEKLMRLAGASHLVGPGEWASGPGWLRGLMRSPLMVCFMDELGDELSNVNNQKANAWVSKIIGELKKCYNAWATIRTADKAGEESETIYWPAVSLVGAATPQMFFEGLRPRDLESGFANRLLILPFEGGRRPPEQETPKAADEPPKGLVAGLMRLPRQMSIAEQILHRPTNGEWQPLPRKRMEWGSDAAKEAYFAFSQKMDGFEETDPQRFELGMRACENAARLATIVAVGRGSPTVDLEDITWAVALSERSFEAAAGGIVKYMIEYFEFPKFCTEVGEAIQAAGGFMSDRELFRKFGRRMRFGNELEKALFQLVREERIERATRTPPYGGHAATGYAWKGE